jgi:hypothetical protein
MPIWTYFPGCAFYLWFSGFLIVKTSWPLAFCIKCIPALVDTAIAVLIFYLLKQISIKTAFNAGLLYALCPIPIIIIAIHGQYDMLFIFFSLLGFYIRDYFEKGISSAILFGLFFAFAVLLKPVALLFAPFFFVPFPSFFKKIGCGIWYLLISAMLGLALMFYAFYLTKTNNWDLIMLIQHIQYLIILYALIVGASFTYLLSIVYKQMRLDLSFKAYIHYAIISVITFILVMTLACMIFYHMLHFNLFALFDTILRYFNQGIQIFGFPFAIPSQGMLATIVKNRIWLIGIIGIITVFYYRQRCTIFECIALVFFCILGFAGIVPNYLFWPIPFIIINQWYTVAAMYIPLSSIFLLLYYANPFANATVFYQNGLCFAPLKEMMFFCPPAWSAQTSLKPLIDIIGNVMIPVFSMGTLFVMLFLKKAPYSIKPLMIKSLLKNSLFIGFVCITTMISLLIVFYQTSLSQVFLSIITIKLEQYITIPAGVRLTTLYVGRPIFNIIVIGIIGSLIWAVYAYVYKRRSLRKLL